MGTPPPSRSPLKSLDFSDKVKDFCGVIDGSYVYLSLTDLQTLKASCLACLQDNFTAHQSYTIAGRTITRANIGQVSSILVSVNYAIAYLTGSVPRTTLADMSGDAGRRCR